MATTHVTILQEAKNNKVKTSVIHGASIFDAISETGLQFYKFGKTASMPNFDADSYTEIIRQNLSIQAHTLILVDIGMRLEDALKKLSQNLKKSKIKVEDIVLCS